MSQKIHSILRDLTKHNFIELSSRGNSAIESALSSLQGKVLIPEEGGWLTYKKLPLKVGLDIVEVKCTDSKINLIDLKDKVQDKKVTGFLYQNPGGYFAEQDMQEIYKICQENDCKVILDVSGSIGTVMCDGTYADIIVGSFGKWKLVEASSGGFISCKDQSVWESISKSVNNNKLDDDFVSVKILDKLNDLPERITFLLERRDKVVKDLSAYNVIHKDNTGFVVVVMYLDQDERKKIIKYCADNSLEWTECPRYIRLNKDAISIEIKRL